MEVRHGLTHLRHARSQIEAFQTRGAADVALKVLPPDLGLSRNFSDRRERAQSRSLAGRAGEYRVFHSVQRRPVSGGEADAQRVSPVADDDGSRRGLALENGGGI